MAAIGRGRFYCLGRNEREGGSLASLVHLHAMETDQLSRCLRVLVLRLAILLIYDWTVRAGFTRLVSATEPLYLLGG